MLTLIHLSTYIFLCLNNELHSKEACSSYNILRQAHMYERSLNDPIQVNIKILNVEISTAVTNSQSVCVRRERGGKCTRAMIPLYSSKLLKDKTFLVRSCENHNTNTKLLDNWISFFFYFSSLTAAQKWSMVLLFLCAEKWPHFIIARQE